ncbi:MAG: DNA polymerase III subunit psi [Flavobacteriales bacterium]|nr:DNA polymerase III subunit psi [Flavobacteriales bacterium]
MLNNIWKIPHRSIIDLFDTIYVISDKTVANEDAISEVNPTHYKVVIALENMSLSSSDKTLLENIMAAIKLEEGVNTIITSFSSYQNFNTDFIILFGYNHTPNKLYELNNGKIYCHSLSEIAHNVTLKKELWHCLKLHFK